MTEKPGVRLEPRFQSLSRAAGLTVTLIGLTVLAGWILNIRPLTSVSPDLVSMKANTALCFVVAGLCLWMSAAAESTTRRRGAVRTGGALLALVGLLTLLEYLSGRDLGIDQVLVRDVPGAVQTAAPGRMAPLSGLSFVLIAAAIVLLDSRRGRSLAQILALGTALVSLLALMGYAYDERSLYQVLPFTSVALFTAVSFLVLSVGVLFARPGDALMEIVSKNDAGGAVARRLLPAAVLVPFLLGWIRLAGQRAGLYGAEFSLALVAVASIVILSALTWWHAGRLHRADLERRRAVEGLSDALQTLRALVDASPVAIVGIDLQGRVMAWNPAAERMFGWRQDDLLGRPLPSPPESGPQTVADLRGAVGRGEPLRNVEAVYSRKDGSRIEVSLSAAPLYDGSRRIRGGIAVFADISERRSLEEQVRLSQKLEAVGRLAGGVAHDFNNLLTVIGGCIELTLLRLPPDSPLRKSIEEAEKAVRHAADLTHQLLAFSRKQVLEPKVLALDEIVRGMEKMLSRLIGEDVLLTLAGAEGLGRVKADRSQIEQVIMNLVVNARDAMPHGGRLTIETRNADLDGGDAAHHVAVRAGPYVMLAVSDTGAGMPPSVQARIFEPFFTTKELGHGTGLGLSTVYGIVKQSGGYIWVYSEPGKGTTFKVYLPRTEDQAEALEETPSRGAPTGSETILLVEDDALVRDVVGRMLSGLGYRVLEAKGGEEALVICDEHAGAIDLLMTDVVMPKMNGRQIAERATLIRPSLKVLYISGYTDEAIVKLGMLEPGLSFLHKPFSRETVGRKVRAVLDQKIRGAGTGAA